MQPSPVSCLFLACCAALTAAAIGCSSSDEKKQNGDDAGAGPITQPMECNGIALPPRAVDRTKKPAAGLDVYFPTDEWRTATPEEAGMDAAKLKSALDFTTPQSKTQGILVLRAGYIVAEQYASGFTKDTRTESYSMAKSFSSALVGIARERNLLITNTRICGFYADTWDCSDDSDPRTRITVEHTMNVETGLEWHEDWRSTASFLDNDTLKASADLLTYVLSRKGVDEPGTVKRYSTGDPSLLTGVLQGVTGKTALEFAREVLFEPIGIPGVQWNTDKDGHTTTYAGLQATLREYGKFGLLYANHGKWDGAQIVPGDWVDFTTRALTDRCTEQYRYLWHINAPARLGHQDPNCGDFPSCAIESYADLPGDAFFAEGIQGQFIFIVPSMDLVVVRGAQDAFGSDYWDDYAREFLTRVVDSVDPS